MSRSTNPFTIPASITDQVASIMAGSRSRFGHGQLVMTSTPPEPTPTPTPPPTPTPAPAPAPTPPAGPAKPDGVSDTEWAALGDPGRTALVRERDARTKAERELAASKARPTPPTPAPTPAPSPTPLDPNDVQGMINAAVAAAVKPFTDAEETRRTHEAAAVVRTTVVDAAKSRLHDATDALTNIDLTTVINDQGVADPEKVKTAIDELVTKKPHLAKPTGRQAPPGIGGGAPAGASEKEKVAAVLADMQKATGVRTPSTT